MSHDQQHNVTRRRVSTWLLSSTLMIGCACLAFVSRQSAAEEADAAAQADNRMQSMNHARQIVLAMHTYPEGFPAAAIYAADGKPLLSWRVAILKEIGQKELYQQFRLDEPWDSDHNKKLLAKMPDVYRAPAAAPDSIYTSIVAVVGQRAFMTSEIQPREREILGRTANAIAVVEAKTDIPWTKPDDIEFDPEKELPKIEGWHRGDDGSSGFIAGVIDGTIRFISENTNKDDLKMLLTFYDQETLERR